MARASERGRIFLFRPAIRDEAIEAVTQVLRSGWLGLGPRTREFEEAFAEYVDAPHCVALNSCTAALHLGLHVLDLPADSEIITTPLTFVSANQTILQCGYRPVFAEIEPTTGNLDVRSVEEKITRRTKAILVMHYGGYPCDLDEFYALAQNHGLHVLEDCAHACGATYRGRRIGSHGDLHAFSFQAVKNLPIGDGGALTLRSADLDTRVRKLRWFGIDADTYERASGRRYRWDYRVRERGFKYHMNDIEAAIGLAQLAYLDRDNARRAELAGRYRRGLSRCDGLELLEYEADRVSSNHLFCVLAENRDLLVDRLTELEIDVGVHYRPSYDYEIFESEPLESVEAFWRRVVSLPMHVGLSDQDVDEVIEAIREGW